MALQAGTGGSLGDHLQSAARQMRKLPPHLEKQEAPIRAIYLWEYFLELTRRRSRDGFSGIPQPLQYQEIASWASLRGVRLESFEVGILIRLDDTFLEVSNKHQAEKAKTKEAFSKPRKTGK